MIFRQKLFFVPAAAATPARSTFLQAQQNIMTYSFGSTGFAGMSL